MAKKSDGSEKPSPCSFLPPNRCGSKNISYVIMKYFYRMQDVQPYSINKPVFKLNAIDDQFKVQPLPTPTGVPPFRLNISDVGIETSPNKMVFHMLGDTGSARLPQFQQLVANEMAQQFSGALKQEDQPKFLYHLGDVVYHFGEAEEYYRQFFKPYKNYPAPVFAIAGNHDSDINTNARTPYKSLDPFMRVFCNTKQEPINLAEDTGRKTMLQPNVYWTLVSPLATIIGLYSNVPKFGYVSEEQKAWFVNELREASVQKGKALIVCIHHAPYSADANHGSSRNMITLLESAFEESGVLPDIVFSGHVHNYQRFSKKHASGKQVAYIVAGAGGYVTLFPLVPASQPGYTGDDFLLNDVGLITYCDSKHGFLKISIEKNGKVLSLSGEYYTIPHDPQISDNIHVPLFDQFTIPILR